MPGLFQLTFSTVSSNFPVAMLPYLQVGTFSSWYLCIPHNTHLAVSLRIRTYVHMKADWCPDEQERFNCTYVMAKLRTYDYMNFLHVQVNLLPVPK